MGLTQKNYHTLSMPRRIYLWLDRHILVFIALIIALIFSWQLIIVYVGFYRTGFIHQKIYGKISETHENRLLQYRFNQPLLIKTATWHCHLDMYELPKDLTTDKLSQVATPYNAEKARYHNRCFDAPIWGLQKPPYKEKWLFFNLKYVGNESGHKHWDILVKGNTKTAPLVTRVSDEIWQMNDDKRQFVMIDRNTNTLRIIESYWNCGFFLCN